MIEPIYSNNPLYASVSPINIVDEFELSQVEPPSDNPALQALVHADTLNSREAQRQESMIEPIATLQAFTKEVKPGESLEDPLVRETRESMVEPLKMDRTAEFGR